MVKLFLKKKSKKKLYRQLHITVIKNIYEFNRIRSLYEENKINYNNYFINHDYDNCIQELQFMKQRLQFLQPFLCII